MPVSPKVREPSIDEILDSIRRIIADEDMAADNVDDTHVSYPPSPAQSASGGQAVQKVAQEHVANRHGAGREGNGPSASEHALRPKVAVPERAGRYAPVMATQPEPAVAEPRYQPVEQPHSAVRVVNPPVREPEPRRKPVAGHKLVREPARHEPRYPVAQAQPARAMADEMSKPESAVPENNPAPKVSMDDAPSRLGDERMSNTVSPSSGQSGSVRPRQAAAPVAPEPRAPLPRRDLLSPAVDAAVTAAFQSLGDLVLPQHERTVEDLVKEILRPMLKEWLDQNLAGIVERLVRAEIERVTGSIR